MVKANLIFHLQSIFFLIWYHLIACINERLFLTQLIKISGANRARYMSQNHPVVIWSPKASPCNYSCPFFLDHHPPVVSRCGFHILKAWWDLSAHKSPSKLVRPREQQEDTKWQAAWSSRLKANSKGKTIAWAQEYLEPKIAPIAGLKMVMDKSSLT